MCPGSYIRRAWGATPGVKARKYKSRRPGQFVVEVGWSRGRATLGAAALSERCSVVSVDHQELPLGVLNASSGTGSAEPVVEGRRPVSAGKESDACTCRALRRMGGGTERRIDGAKQGRSPCQPRLDRMARTRRITAKTGNRGEAGRLAAEVVVAKTARTTQPRLSEGPLGGRGRRWRRAGVVPVLGYHAPGHSAVQAACLKVISCGGGEGGRPTARGATALGLVGEPVGAAGAGTLSLIGARLQPDWGEPNVRLIGGREETGASRLVRAAYGASRLPDTRSTAETSWSGRGSWCAPTRARPASTDRPSLMLRSTASPSSLMSWPWN